jgi:Silencing defective 2 N-terminal ubiquitin domain
MSSRKKRNAEAQNGSNRNLDGRRLRTITEAKNLATYLATKPEMDRREKEERRKRWEAVVEAAERREEEIRSGKKGKGLSEEWVAEKEEVGEGVRDAVRRALMGGARMETEREKDKDEVEGGSGSGSGSGSGASGEASEEDSEGDAMELDDEDMKRLKDEAATGDVDAIWVLKNKVIITKEAVKPKERRYAGFDDEDEFLSSDDEVDISPAKGKAKA